MIARPRWVGSLEEVAHEPRIARGDSERPPAIRWLERLASLVTAPAGRNFSATRRHSTGLAHARLFVPICETRQSEFLFRCIITVSTRVIRPLPARDALAGPRAACHICPLKPTGRARLWGVATWCTSRVFIRKGDAMTRSNKKPGPSTRSKQPVWRRARKPAQRSTAAPGASLRKLRSTPPPPRLDTASEAALDETPTPLPAAPRSAPPFEPPPDERPTPVMPEARTNALLTERPVALPLTSEFESTDSNSEVSANTPAPVRPEQEKGANAWMLAAAALMLIGVVWVAFGNWGSMSSNSDASAGKLDSKLPESPLPAAVPPTTAVPPPAPAIVDPEPTDEQATGEIIDLDAPVSPKPAAARVFSAKPAPRTPKAVEAPRPQATAPFDPSAAESALASAAQRATSCRQDGDPTGVARVVVTFAPSGRVTSATISGPPFAGTATGSCIARTMRAMSLPPFTGDHMTISKTVVIM